MKKLLTMFCLLLMMSPALAQMDGGMHRGGPAPAGRIYGKLLDDAGHGVDMATVVVLKNYTDSTGAQKKQLLKGTTTESNGDFSLDDLPVNTPLKLSITAVEYNDLNLEITLTPQASQKDLGNLRMATSQKNLKEVTVTATKPYMTMDMEKKVYNVSKDIVSAGGNGLDVLKNVPSVNVDIDGNVSLRGGSPQLFIDGKPTTLTLDEIPSDAIESVEVIANPSAKYDASGGGAGILNIVLKKNHKSGYNGNVRAGTDGYGGVNGGANINIRNKKINFSADVNARKQPDYVTGSIQRTTTSTTPETYLNQNEKDTAKNSMIFSKLSLDYYITNRTTLSASVFAMQHNNQSTSNIGINTDSLYSAATTSDYNQERISSNRTFGGRGATLGITHNFPKEKETWSADANYFSGNFKNNSQYVTTDYAEGYGTTATSTELQKIIGNGNDHNIILQSDFSDPLTSKINLEAGVRAALQSRENINNNYTYDAGSSEYLLVPEAASNYKSQSNVYAAYTTLGGNIGNFSYKGGLRAESSNYEGTLLNSGETFSNKYPLELFPSVFFGQKLGHDQELQLSYTRRVNRPNFFQLVPYTDSSNKLNITRGNPNLVPEFTQSIELSYLKNFKGSGTLMGSLYYKYTDHLITGYIESDTTSSGSVNLINTYINAESSHAMGAELTGQFTLTKWWDFSSNVNIYQSQINLGTDNGVSQPALWSWFGKLNTNFKLPAGFAIQLSGMYQSKSNLPVNTNGNQPGPPNMQAQSAAQGYIKPYYEVDVAVKKTFHAGKLVASVSCSDIFRSRIQDQYTYSDYFTQEYTRLRDPQMLRLNLTYNFGKLDANLFERKKDNVQVEE